MAYTTPPPDFNQVIDFAGDQTPGKINNDFNAINPAVKSAFGVPQQSQQAVNFFTSAGQGGLQSPQSFDTAAARLRERVGQAANQQRQSFRDDALGRGMGTSSPLRRDLRSVNQGELSAYGQGLNDLSNQFEERRLQGLGITNQAAAGLSDSNNLIQQLMLGKDTAAANLTGDLLQGKDRNILEALLGANKGKADYRVGLESLDADSMNRIMQWVLQTMGTLGTSGTGGSSGGTGGGSVGGGGGGSVGGSL